MNRLINAAKEVLADHEERIRIYPRGNSQLNRVRVMELLSDALKESEKNG